jgi:hypothetical protein
MLLVRQVSGPETATLGTCLEYRCTVFNETDPAPEALQQINWVVVLDSGTAVAHFPDCGPVLDFAPLRAHAGRTIYVRPFLNQPSDQVQVTTRLASAAPAPGPAPAPAPAPGPGPGPAPAPAAGGAPIELDVSLEGNKYYAAPAGGQKVYVGTDVTYGDLRGLMTLQTQAGSTWDVEAAATAYGHWIYVLAPTATCESEGRFTCINSYDRARFTFGLMQWAAHTPDANFVLLLRRLLQLPSAGRIFPDLALSGGRVAQRTDGGLQVLETDNSTAALQDYLNPTPYSVGRQEALVAARFVYWAVAFAEHRQAQLDFAVDDAKQRIASYARQYELDGQRDDIVLIVFDIRHQGRASSAQIRSALQAGDPKEALLQLGADRYPQRIQKLRQQIQQYVQAGKLGRSVYDAASGSWAAA